MEKRSKLYKIFWIFIIGSIVGWIIEGIFTFVTMHTFQNHSAVVLGPFDMAYGFGGILLTFLLYKFRNDNILKIFIIGFIGGSILEYVMSWGQELVMGFCAWNYSTEFLNINGRICLLYSLFWGIIAIAWIKLIFPFIEKIIAKMDYKIGKTLAIYLAIFLVFDIALTVVAINRARACNKGIAPKNKFERVLDKTFNDAYLGNMYGYGWEHQK